MRWVTFDCFGTLVDWNGGFASILQPLAGDRTPDLIAAYHRFERLLESETPHLLYRDVLVRSVTRAAREVGVDITDAQARALPEQWGSMRLFDDVEPMLAGLREDDWHLAVLTNCDKDLFEETERAFSQPFDLVVTAEQVGSYKPRLRHFTHFHHDVRPSSWVHVACSWFHDIAPARELGLARVWLDRDRTGDDPRAASARVESAADVRAIVGQVT